MVSGPLLHEGILMVAYQANASFWRPEFNQQPPDMAAIFANIRGTLDGAAWMKGLKFGVIAFRFSLCVTRDDR